MIKCRDCKYFVEGKKEDTGFCHYGSDWELTKPENNCRYIQESKKPVCGDCGRLTSDPGCAGCMPAESALIDGRLCGDFIYKQESDFYRVLEYWKSRGIYDRAKIDQKIDDFEKRYDDIVNQNRI